MSTEQKTTSNGALRLRSSHLGGFLLAWTTLAWSPANATTESETVVINSPMPHEKLRGGHEPVKVHWVRLRGYVEDKTGHAAMLAELKAQVQACMRSPLSGQSRPPRVWPDYVQSIQIDTYEAANREITYSTSLVYGLNPLDCSLIETRGEVAQLASIKGTCQINLIHKTAHGICDARAHVDAPVYVNMAPQTSASSGRAGSANSPSQAAIAAMKDAMKQFTPTKTGERKTIAGIECEVQTHPLFGTVCTARGGSFTGSRAAHGGGGAGIELEQLGVAGITAQAVKAQLDASVNAAVFAPYLADGFQVTNITRRK